VSEAARGAWRAAAVLLLGSSMGKREERNKDSQTDKSHLMLIRIIIIIVIYNASIYFLPSTILQ
jgi:hypothetical protein